MVSSIAARKASSEPMSPTATSGVLEVVSAALDDPPPLLPTQSLHRSPGDYDCTHCFHSVEGGEASGIMHLYSPSKLDIIPTNWSAWLGREPTKKYVGVICVLIALFWLLFD
ncbi:hypothetical protein Aple_037210 [Acrocarpospora pleiomorpha]|uniref:Uncharacterized protein n=1 Tax=Acrocarpospora pleiomorpha TaxID=90975 RepID=A0A5M3XH15_9ACTN|nr:hypothetical protein Aple_037210 [Acrocarpospora pleiomorpha]